MTFEPANNEFGILRLDGTTKVGVMLARDKDGNPWYRVYDDKYNKGTLVVDTPGYGVVDPLDEVPIIQTSWRSGMGGEYADSADPERFFKSVNWDSRHKGMGIPSNTPNAASNAFPLSLSDLGFEAWDDATTPTTWLQVEPGTGAVTRDGVDQEAGTFCAKLDTGASGSAVALYQAAVTWNNDYRSAKITWKVRVKASDASEWKAQVKEVGSTSESSFHSGGGGYETLTVEHTFSGTADQCRCQVINTGGGVNKVCFVDTASHPYENGPIVYGVTFNGDEYFGKGTWLYKIAASDGAVSLVKVFAQKITNLTPFADGNLYIAFGTSQNYWYMNTSESFTESNATNKTYKHFGVLDAAAPTLYGNDGDNTMRSTVDPTNGGTAWSGQTIVETPDYAITKIMAVKSVLYMMKEDKPFYLDTSGNVKVLTNQTQHIASSTSGQNSTEWNGNLHMNWGEQAHLEYNVSGGTFRWLNPADRCVNLGDYDGIVQALAGDEAYLYVIVDNGSKIEILVARDETVGSITNWVIHPLVSLTLSGCQTAWISSVYKKRLWIASTAADESLYYIALPDGYGDIPNDANRDFQNNAEFHTSFLHGGFRGDIKASIKVTLEMENTSSTDYFEVYYKKHGDSAWTSIGDFKTSPSTTKYIPVDGSAKKPASKFIRFKVICKRSATSAAPTLKQIDVRALLYPQTRRLHEIVIDISANMVGKQGIVLDDSAEDIKAAIEEITKDFNWPVICFLALGDAEVTATTLNLRFIASSGPLEQPLSKMKGEPVTWRFKLLAEEVRLS